MLIVHRIGPEAGRYYFGGRPPGEWTPGASRLLGRVGLVGRADLERVLGGRDPQSGRYLPDARPRANRRRAGWDLIFCAPKTVSLLASGDDRAVARAVVAAHRVAVDSMVTHLEAGLQLRAVVGTAPGSPAAGLIGAAFMHSQSAAGEPHLHTHLLVANLSRSGSVWGAIQPADWQLDRTALTARYQLELRHQLERNGLGLDWRLRADGLADVIGIPRDAVRATSTQGRLAASRGHYEARAAARPTRWREELQATGWPGPTREPPGSAPAPPMPSDHLDRAVATRLTARRSDFRRADVTVALAASHPGGMSNRAVTEWVDAFCERCIPVASPTHAPRWATPAAQRIDAELRDALLGRAGPTVVVAGGHPGHNRLLDQAELLDSWRRRWEADGATVAVAADDRRAEQRWAVLAGLAPHRPDRPADVVIVDGADRRTSHSLLTLARSTTARLVLVEGGTWPRLSNPASHGARDAAGELGRVEAPQADPWRLGGVRFRAGREPPSTGRRAAEALLSDWEATGRAGVMVGLGVEEVKALNQAVAAARPPGPTHREGDPVVVLKGGGGLPRYGTLGTVWEAEPLTVAWPGRSAEAVRAEDQRRIGPAWAVSSHAAGSITDRPHLVLAPTGDPSLGRARMEERRPVRARSEAPGLSL